MVVGGDMFSQFDQGNIVVVVFGVVFDVDNDLVRLDDPLIGVQYPDVVVTD